MSSHILIIDDEPNYLLILEALLSDSGYAVTTLSDPETALAFMNESEVDVVITDMKMPKLSGQDVLEHTKKNFPYIPVLIMTAYGSIEAAVEAMKVGAFDYISKPFSNDELMLSVTKAAQFAKAQQQFKLLHESLEDRYGLHRIIGKSKVMKKIREVVDRAAQTKSNVLITGESGTGKELVAKAFHFASPRNTKPFVAVGCANMPSETLERELFGQEQATSSGATAKNRGRMESAAEGTLFLDEIHEMSLELQGKLLRVLEEGEFVRLGGDAKVEADFRLIVSSDNDLYKAVEKGAFREDLYYKINVVQVNIPPLRERREDIPLLAAHFVHKYSDANDMPEKTFTPEAMDYLTSYEWPGNVRQLENISERCMVLAAGAAIGVEDLPPEIKDEESQFKSAVDLLPVKLNLADTLEKIEAALVRRALVKSGFVQVKAAELIGVSKSLLQYKLKKYKITGH